MALVKQIIGLTRPDSGRIVIDGVNTVSAPGIAMKVTSHQPQSDVPIDALNPIQAIETVGRLRGGGKHHVRRRAAELMEALEIGEWRKKMGAQLSGGVRRLVGFAMAAVVPGKVVILDEPTNDVDPLRRRLLWHQIEDLATRGSAVLLVTHNVLEAERSVNRLAVVDRGRVLKMGTPAEFRSDFAGALRIEAILEPGASQLLEPEAPRAPLPAFIDGPAVRGRRLRATVSPAEMPHAVEWAQMLPREHVAEEYSIGPTSLEDAYVRLIDPGNGAVDEDQTSGRVLVTVA
jgi:ABC-2 type transport system ATP-binding protein